MSLGSQKKALVLLITESSVQVLSWQQKRLTEILLLQNSKDEQEVFVDLVRQYSDYPVIIVADLIDENFRQDTIVHVSGSDREALMQRKLDFSYRNTSYRIGIITGRLSEGRRDDKVLLCALSKPDRIEFWVSLLLQEKMAIQAVSSVAHLLSVCLPLEKLDTEENLLITNLENNISLRQTFIKKGKVVFSRLVTLKSSPEKNISTEILQETIQLRQYLERIQLLSYESVLATRILAPHTTVPRQIETQSTEYNTFQAVDVSEQAKGLDIDIESGPLSPSHYLIARILDRDTISNIYGPASITRFNDLKAFARLLLVSAATILVVGIGLNIPGFTSLLEKREQASMFAARAIPLRSEYEQLTRRFPETPIPPREMALIVSTHDVIASQIHDPVDTLNLIAESLASAPGLQLTSIDWELAAMPDGENNGGQPVSRFRNFGEENILSRRILEQRTRLEVIITGQASSPDSIREAQNQVESFSKALSTHAGVSISDTQMPFDVRNDISLSTTISDAEVRAPFEIQLVIEQPTDGTERR